MELLQFIKDSIDLKIIYHFIGNFNNFFCKNIT